MHTLNYSEDFKARVKKVYPDWERLHELLDQNNPIVGRYLYDSAKGYIESHAVLAATSLAELQELARKEEEKLNLYKERGAKYA